MDKSTEKCLKKWSRIANPNNNLSEAFVKKSRNDLIVLRSMPESDKEWKAATAYYARYHILTALMLKIGVECKDHNCSIKIAEYLFSDMISKKTFSDIKAAKKQRINLQYYTDRPVNNKEFDNNMKNVDNFIDTINKVLDSLTREKINKIRRKLK